MFANTKREKQTEKKKYWSKLNFSQAFCDGKKSLQFAAWRYNDWIHSCVAWVVWVIFATNLNPYNLFFIHSLIFIQESYTTTPLNNFGGAIQDQNPYNIQLWRKSEATHKRQKQRITQHFKSPTIRKFFPLHVISLLLWLLFAIFCFSYLRKNDCLVQK